MTALTWDDVGERTYQTGVDRGVLFLNDGTVVPWNGLTSIDENSASEVKPYYLEGVKYLQNFVPGDYEGKLKALTYPEEFDTVMGLGSIAPGLDFYDQPASSFSLAYRTKIGNDVSQDLGYKIHILYNIYANPDDISFSSLDDSSVSPTEFGWDLTGTPTKLVGFRPTVHISIDSTQTPPEVMAALEDALYGTDATDPRLPSMAEVAGYFGYLSEFVVIDHGDGTWTAIDATDSYITMTDDTTFSIHGDFAVYLDADTYTLSSGS